MINRYSRNMPAFSPEECAEIRTKRVCVVGCGGLGGYIIELLARFGVGALTVADGDAFDASNLNRQLLSDEGNIGVKKAEAAKLRVGNINSDVDVTAAAELFTSESASRLLSGCDLAVDALDNAQGRLLLADSCAGAGIHMVHGAISGFCAQVTVIAPGAGTLTKLYPSYAGTPVSLGNPGFIAAMCASVQAAQALELLAGRRPALLGKLLLMDLKRMDFTQIEI